MTDREAIANYIDGVYSQIADMRRALYKLADTEDPQKFKDISNCIMALDELRQNFTSALNRHRK